MRVDHFQRLQDYIQYTVKRPCYDGHHEKRLMSKITQAWQSSKITGEQSLHLKAVIETSWSN